MSASNRGGGSAPRLLAVRWAVRDAVPCTSTRPDSPMLSTPPVVSTPVLMFKATPTATSEKPF